MGESVELLHHERYLLRHKHAAALRDCQFHIINSVILDLAVRAFEDNPSDTAFKYLQMISVFVHTRTYLHECPQSI